jgi:tetratricopeptide (TPR) repeat protein
VFQRVAPGFQDLIDATEAQKTLAETSVSFLESLGGINGGDEAFQVELARIYREMASALGSPFMPNTLGNYEKALQFANQSLAIEENLRRSHPNDEALLTQLAFTEDQVGLILGELGRSEGALVHHRQSLELFQRLLKQNPRDANLAHWVITAHRRIGNDLRAQGRPKEALEQHYLPYGQHELEQALDPTLGSREAHWRYVAHLLVGLAEMQLNQPSNALPQFEAALRWKQMQVEREPNNAQWARDWSQIHSELGAAQIGLGRVEVGLANLQEAVRLAAEIQARQEKISSAAMAQVKASETGKATEIARELDQARAALAKLTVADSSMPAKR